MASDPNFSAWYFEYCQKNNRTPSQEDVWQAGREFGHGDTIPATPADSAQPPEEAECDRIINRLMSSDPDFEDCEAAAKLIRSLADQIKGPDGYATWKDAAIAERILRVKAEAAPPAPVAADTLTDETLAALRELRAACSYVRPLVGSAADMSKVEGIRQAGRFMAACERADAVLAKASGDAT